MIFVDYRKCIQPIPFFLNHEFTFVHEVCIIHLNKQRQIYINSSIPSPHITLHMRMCHAESQNRKTTGLYYSICMAGKGRWRGAQLEPAGQCEHSAPPGLPTTYKQVESSYQRKYILLRTDSTPLAFNQVAFLCPVCSILHYCTCLSV